jgi:hypothetical protein
MSEIPARPGIPRIGWVVAFLVAAGLIGLAYVNLKSTRPPALPSNLEKICQVPAFQLTDQTGKSITLEDLKGKIWAANFIFTRCKGPCPITVLRMQDLNTKLKKVRGNVELVTFTVDPEYDTPEILKANTWWDIAPISAGIFGVPLGFAVIIIVSLLTKAPDQEVQDMVENVRFPSFDGKTSQGTAAH